MDELLHHCIRELAFEGDLGCDVNRLQGFIEEFYAHTGSQQNVDSAFCAFVWSSVAQHPEVRVGVAPEDATEVFIAPQPSKGASSSKSKKKKEEEDLSAVGASALHVVEDYAVKSLDELKAQYGEQLRIAVDPKRAFIAITGSENRPSKLSPMVYTALQLISRGRENGISVVDLSRKTGYDPKTCHYLVEKLLELNFIEKRKKSGVGTNFCIHKYFFERSDIWQDVVAEEKRANEAMAPKKEEDLDIEMEGEESTSAPIVGNLHFDPIDSRHLSSLALVRSRLEKLLRNSPHHMHSSQNLLVIIGFANPVKSDRRFFQCRLRELIAQGFIEKVQVPREKGKYVSCIRLVNPNAPEQQQDALPTVEVIDVDEEPTLKANVTFHKQLTDLVDKSGTEGATLNQLSQALCTFDKRTVDHQLNRLKETPIPPHLRDLGIVQLAETHGRERRYKYFTARNYQKIIEREKLDAPYDKDYFAEVGGFMPVKDDQFYKTSTQLNKYIDDWPVSGDKGKGTGKGRGRPKKDTKAPARGKKRKRDETETIDLTVEPPHEEPSTSTAPPVKRKRGAQSEVPLVTNKGDSMPVAGPSTVQDAQPEEPVSVPKRRGRPPKKKSEAEVPKKRGRPPKNKAAVNPPENEAPQGKTTMQAALIRAPEGSRQSTPQLFDPEPVIQPPSRVSALQDESEVVEIGGSYRRSTRIAQKEPAAADMSRGATPPSPTEPNAMAVDEPWGTLSEPASLSATDVLLASSASAIAQDSTGTPEASASPRHPTSSTTIEPAIHQKRSAPSPPPTTPAIKRLKTETPQSGYRARTNISQSRREKEILQVIADLGGIANVSSKEFYDKHAELVEDLSKSGEVISTKAGARIDKRTVDFTIQSLQAQGKATVITTMAGSNRQAKIIYLAETSQEDLNAYLTELGRTQLVPSAPANVKTLDSPLSFGGAKSVRVARPQAPVIPLSQLTENEHDKNKAAQLLQADEATVKASLLTEQNTIVQLYGFIVGKIARAKALHLHTMRVFEVNENSHIVSNEQRVLHLPYYFLDLPISVYSAVVSCRAPSDELKELLSTPEGQATPLSQVPSAIADAFEINKARSRTRMLDMMVVLQHLHLVTPLLPTDSDRPWLRCAPNGEHPTAFDTTVYDGTAPLQAPQYWHFNTNVPIHLWALDEISPTFWMTLPVKSCAEAEEFWQCLLRASTDQVYADQIATQREQEGPQVPSIPADIPVAVVRLMRRPTQWKATYTFSWFQKQYLRKQTDPQTGATPLQDPDGGEERIAKIADIVSAPRVDVVQFYQHERSKMLHDIEKVRRKNDSAGERSKRRADESVKLAQKAKEAKAQKERDWDAMVSRVHAQPLAGTAASRVKNVRSKFLQGAGTDHQKWEAEIASAIEQAKAPTNRASTSRVPLVPHIPVQPVPAPPPLQLGGNEKSIDELISQQGPVIVKPDPTTKKKEKGKEKEKGKSADREGPGKIIRRRHRFQWTKDYDELARDASAVIKVRARGGKRLDWSALEQVFPAVPRNSVRQRITSLREQVPGAETYFKRLEDRWHDLWTKHRGTPELPDEDPSSLSNFDIVAHVKFLRNHVDKNALRVGFVETTQPTSVALPTDVSAILEQWEVVEKPLVAPTWDFLWSGQAEEGREKQFAHQPLTLNGTKVPPTRSYPSDSVYVADAALKMMMGTPNDVYDADHASDMLNSAGEREVKIAMTDMLERGVVSKVVRDPKRSKPGRVLKISEANQNAVGGPVPLEQFQDASALEEALSNQEDALAWREWPLLATDGDVTALIEMVSDNKLEFKVDTTSPQAARARIDWNSKKADDDDIETSIQMRISAGVSAHSLPTQALVVSRETTAPNDVPTTTHSLVDVESARGPQHEGNVSDHGEKNVAGQRACCRQALAADDCATEMEFADCQECIEQQLTLLALGEVATLAREIYDHLAQAGPGGLPKKQLLSYAKLHDDSLFRNALTCLTAERVAFWAGYREISLVAAAHLSRWTVIVSPELPASTDHEDQSEGDAISSSKRKPVIRSFPRRWLDIHGHEMADAWDAACRAVIGIVVLHPGISQMELRWRLRSVYDRMEVHDVLSYLLKEGFVRQKGLDDADGPLPADSPPDNSEESLTFWFIGDRTWFAV